MGMGRRECGLDLLISRSSRAGLPRDKAGIRIRGRVTGAAARMEPKGRITGAWAVRIKETEVTCQETLAAATSKEAGTTPGMATVLEA